MEGVVSVFRSRTMKLHTTRSWDFMGLTLEESSEVTPLQLAYGDDIVVGVLDSGTSVDTFSSSCSETLSLPTLLFFCFFFACKKVLTFL